MGGDIMSYFIKDYLENIAMGGYSNIVPWSKMGFTPTMTTSESDLWTAAGVYAFPSAEMTVEIVSSDNAADIATAIRGTLPATPLTCDVGGTTTRLVDVSQDFNAATAVQVGDILLVDPYGTTPEWGYITTIDAAGDYVDFTGGLSSGGSCATARNYFILDKNAAAKTGAFAVKVAYLDDDYLEYEEIITINGTTPVHSQNANFFRINSIRVIATGSGNRPTGNLSLKDSGGAATYSYITALYTRARNCVYTVPSGKTLWVTDVHAGFGFVDAAKAQNQYCRLWTKANREPSTGFLTGSIFYPYSSIISVYGQGEVHLDMPTKLLAKTDIKVSGIASAAGVASSMLRGFLVTG
jgi:hypothetical protein